ncbi:MAG: sugar transferase [Bacteroidaceae bacterium]|nr:sugar transferase [Bacteroidaceae bacterium]
MYKKKKRSWAKHLDFTILDILAAELALFIAIFIKFDGAVMFFDRYEFYVLYEHLAGTIIFIDLLGVFFTESYAGILRRTKYEELTACIVHSSINMGGVLAYAWVTKHTTDYSRIALGIFYIAMLMLSYTFRVLWKRAIRARKLKDVNKSQMIVVAETSTVDACLNEIAFNKYTDFKVVGVVVLDQDMVGQTVQGFDVVANRDTMYEFFLSNVIDEVYIDGGNRETAEKLAGELVEQGLTVHIALLHADQLMPNRMMENYGNYYVLTTCMHIASNRQVFFKRLTDLLGSIAGLLLCAIAFIIFAIPIRVQSKGSVFYKSTRIGKNGRRFKFYKFRTMYVNADERKQDLMEHNEIEGNMFKLENDPRIIPVGHFLRKYSIDELPQFWNVLKGDMSLVGTRPPTEDEYENYALHHKARLSITPGLTGMWQVSGRSDITDFEEVVALDTEYISNWSLSLDLMILLKTIVVVLSGKGSK